MTGITIQRIRELEAENAELKARWDKLKFEFQNPHSRWTGQVIMMVIEQYESGGEVPHADGGASELMPDKGAEGPPARPAGTLKEQEKKKEAKG